MILAEGKTFRFKEDKNFFRRDRSKKIERVKTVGKEEKNKMSIYFNNGATSWPKPECVARAMGKFLTQGGANLGRGSASLRDLETMGIVLECRERIAKFFGGYDNFSPLYVTFTSNVTESLNVVLKGFLRPGMRVVTTSMEHNSVVRPLRHLEKTGVELKIISCSLQGILDLDNLKKALDEKATDLVVMTHCSNVCGTVLDIEGAAKICRERRVPLVVDSAQTAGLLPLNVEKLNLAALCFTGHKGLMGPQGIGGIVWNSDFARECAPLTEGGTGSFSHLETQPEAMPDKFESGTPNLPGIAGLNAALKFVESCGDEILKHEFELGCQLLDGLKKLPGVQLYGLPEMIEGKRLPVFAVNFDGVDNGVLAAELSDRGLETRSGLHCSPLAHRTLGSFPQGALRLSLGFFNTAEEVDSALKILRDALAALCER